MPGLILGIDPGTRKAGFALVDEAGATVELGIESIEALVERVRGMDARRDIRAIALGCGTHSRVVGRSLADLGVPIVLVDERETTLRARKLYFEANPPRGWRRLIPVGMQLPPRPVDDYAAVLIARRFLTDEGLEKITS